MIYIVEDDLNIRQMESYALKNSGYLTEEFDDGVSFFAACEKKLPDLILLDIMLPGDDGLKILQTAQGQSADPLYSSHPDHRQNDRTGHGQRAGSGCR